jgi:HAD superfamily hydrolase (TIGR01549 family)
MKTTKVRPLVQTIAALDQETRREIDEVWTRAELEALPNLKINNKGITLYQKFSGKPLALVTMQGRRVVEEILKKTGLSFDSVVTREDSLSRTRQIEMVIEKLGLIPKDVLMIGDRESDKQAAQKVGCQFLPVSQSLKSFFEESL